MPLSATTNGAGRHKWREFEQRLGADREGAQVAAVDADEVEAELDGAVHFFAVVGLAEDVEAHGVGFVAQSGEERRPVWAETISRMASAPAARASRI